MTATAPTAAATRPRQITRVHQGMPATEGAGVRLTRMLGIPGFDEPDPFLLFDVFRSDNPDDYIAGFPEHPHRGFETVTYMMAGNMRHRDSTGSEGVIRAGGVQWMTAARGIVHSEMPEQQDGLMWGTQLWINLPASDKMGEPGYQEFAADAIPAVDLPGGGRVAVIAGTSRCGATGPVRERPTRPLYVDIQLPAGAGFEERVPEAHSAFVYVIEGTMAIGDREVEHGNVALLGAGDAVTLRGVGDDNRALLIAARPLGEPVARGGPFVMNTQAEIVQAFRDYQSGRF